jgi:NAD-reducing hydrogenase small subunit
VANEDNLELIRTVRARTTTVVSFGDCAVSGNVTALRNLDGAPDPMLRRIYVEAVDLNPGEPTDGVVPRLLPKVLPVHEVVPVDVYLPGCPPSAQKIHMALESVLTGERLPAKGEHTRFG